MDTTVFILLNLVIGDIIYKIRMVNPVSIKKWIVSEIDRQKALEIAEEWNIPFFLSVLLNVRGINDKNEANKFLYGSNNFSDPFEFIDMDRLVKRAEKAIDNFEKICVYGDYDADGITATTLIYLYFKERGANIIYYIPKRDEEGYGLNTSVIDKLKEQDVKLIFTVDNGISAFDEISYAKSIGIDTIITDHHRPPEKMPPADAVVDPYREDCPSTFKSFSGVGVAFKAISAMGAKDVDINYFIDKYSDLVTIGTIGDFIELKGETRDLVRRGIKSITNSKRPGIQAILKNSGLWGRTLDSTNVIFGIVPRINASGRMGSADRAVKLLLSENDDEALLICGEINKENELRKSLENEIIKEIEEQLDKYSERRFDKIIIVEGEGWHHGILGIVASRLVKRFGKPCVLITYDGDSAKGSCRSIEGFSIHDAVSKCSFCLDRFGGHPMAAGINLKTKNISVFRKAILEYADLIGDMPFPFIKIDCKLNPAALSRSMVDQLDKLRPFGSGNQEPIFGIYEMTLIGVRPIGGNRHMRLRFSRGNVVIECVYFSKSESEFLYKTGDILDLAVTLKRNDYMEVNGVSIHIVDVRISGINTELILNDKAIYEKFRSSKEISDDEKRALKPSRDQIVAVYSYLRTHSQKPLRVDVLCERLKRYNIPAAKIYITLDVLEDLKLIKTKSVSDGFMVNIINVKDKVELTCSPILLNLTTKGEEGNNGQI